MGAQKKIAFFCGPDRKFLPDIVNSLSRKPQKFEVRVSQSANDQSELMTWGDIWWFEWCDRMVAAASMLPRVGKIICRLHRFEAFTDIPPKVDWNKVDTLILVANHIKDWLKKKIPDLEERVNVRVIYNGVNLDRFTYKERNRGFNIAYIGYLNFRKNPSLLLQCMKRLVEKDPRYILHIAGSYQDLECELYTNEIIDKLGLRDNIKFSGWVRDLEKWVEDKDFILSTSIHEGHPCGIMEAMASGLKPLIHNFYAAEEMYPRKYLFSAIDEFVDMVMSDEYNPAEYRKYIADNYPLERQLSEIESILTN